MSDQNTVLAGSALPHMQAAKVVGAPDPASKAQIVVVLRADPAGPQPRSLAEQSRLSFADRRRAGARRPSPAKGDLAELRTWADRFGLHETASRLRGRVVTLEGTIQQVEAALAVKTALVEVDGEAVLGFHGEQSLPSRLAPAVIGVLGLDGRRGLRSSRSASTATPPYWPPQVASMYNFPPGHGAGQSIGIVELGGGYVLDDLDAYFTGTEMCNLPQAPTINAISVDGGTNNPNAPNGDGEVCLDIEVAGSIAYEATLNVYFGNPTTLGGLAAMADCISQAVDDGNTVVTSSVGNIWESAVSSTQVSAFEAVLQAAADANVSVLHGAGDWGAWGSTSAVPQPPYNPPSSAPVAQVDYPSSSAWMTTTGGTSLTATSEVVWNDTTPGNKAGATGGGFSTLFAAPSYQRAIQWQGSPLQWRGIPDVAADADPNTGYQISVNGALGTVAGDSATGPLWAALVAILAENLGYAPGFLNPTLYALNAGVYNEITSGNNTYYYYAATVQGYAAGEGWNPCTGLGTPDGTAILGALQVLASTSPQIAAAPDGAGWLECFVIEGASVSTANQVQSTSTGWSSWTSLGQPSGSPLQALVVGTNQDTRLELFTTSGGVMYHDYQNAPGEGNYSGWSSLGNPASASLTGGVAVMLDANGALEIFASGSDQTVWCLVQNGNDPDGWGSWFSLSAPPTALLSGLAIAKNANGTLELFSLGSNGAVWHNYQMATPPGSGWSGWLSLGNPPDIILGQVAAAANQNGSLQVFAGGSDGTVWSAWQVGNGGWSNWSSIGGPSGVTLLETVVILNTSGNLEAFSTGSDGGVWYAAQTGGGNGNWSAWSALGAPSGVTLAQPCITMNSNGGLLEIFSLGSDGNCYHDYQTSSGAGNWSGWSSLADPASTAAAAVLQEQPVRRKAPVPA